MPGEEWVRAFLGRHKKVLSTRMCQNISRSRAAVSVESVNRYFDNLSKTISGVPPENIVDYDETNLSDDPKAKQMIFRRGIKHAERIMNTSKSCVSLMFACTANGIFLPPYVVYKTKRIMNTWVQGGPIGTRYNTSKSGWFDGYIFKDWLQRLAVPYFSQLANDAPRVIIGDNLASHLTADVIQTCEDNNISMIFLPSNSTHLLQPLDVAVYRPMKSVWKKILSNWKETEGKFYKTLPKNHFPRLLFALMEHSDMQNRAQWAMSGFRTTGIYPLNRERVVHTLKNTGDISSAHLVSPLPYSWTSFGK